MIIAALLRRRFPDQVEHVADGDNERLANCILKIAL